MRCGRLDLLKADVEGAELLVLQGAAQTIARFRPHLILEVSIHTERFGYTREAIYRQLLDWGYRVFGLETMPLRPYALLTDDAIYCNVLAVDLRRLQTLMLQDVIDLSGTAREAVRSSAP
ncbi:MAG TPA: FkbM family methyltransferase [Nitrososphaera sp.]|nr:FkbM family methyltransferase [Nitrososphaera sp.]